MRVHLYTIIYYLFILYTNRKSPFDFELDLFISLFLFYLLLFIFCYASSTSFDSLECNDIDPFDLADEVLFDLFPDAALFVAGCDPSDAARKKSINRNKE